MKNYLIFVASVLLLTAILVTIICSGCSRPPPVVVYVEPAGDSVYVDPWLQLERQREMRERRDTLDRQLNRKTP